MAVNATLNGVTPSATLTVNPLIPTLTVSPPGIAGGTGQAAVFPLTVSAPVYYPSGSGALFGVSSSPCGVLIGLGGPCEVDGVIVANGATSASFTDTANQVSQSTIVTMSAGGDVGRARRLNSSHGHTLLVFWERA